MSGRVVPQHEGTVPVTGLAELQAHLAELHQPGNESAPLNHKLFDDVELQLTPSNIPIIQPTLLPPLMSLLKTTTQDPTVVFTLTTKILSPLSFTQCLSLGGAESLISALQSPLPGANLLALNIIQKAAASPAEVDSLAASPELVEELLRTWLSSPDADVGGRATRVLGSLLETDCDIIPETSSSATTNNVNGTGSSETGLVKRHIPGHASLWRLVIWDRHYLEIMVSLCRPAIINRQATFAQDRLLRVIPRLTALHPRAMAISPFPELFPLPEYADDSIGHGLLQWAALSMVDTSDVLMHQTLIVFYESFVSIMRIAGESADKDAIVRNVVKTSTSQDQELLQSLKTLPDRTVQEEAELLAKYISRILD